MYRISVTTIEKYRRYMVGASSYDTEAALLETIKGIFLGNDKTDIGGAYHKIMEGEAQVFDDSLLADNIFFTPEQARPALAFRERHKHMIHEIPVTKVYETRIGPVLVSGRIDGQEGKETEDKKCKFREPDFREYTDSYQWRYYLDMLGTDLFYYDLFEVRGFTRFGFQGSVRTLPGVTFHAHERHQCVRYQQLPGDCRSMLNDFLDYIELRQLWPFLKQTQDAQQPAA